MLTPFYKVRAELKVSARILEEILLRTQIRPICTSGNRRYFTASDISRIKDFLK